MTINNFVCKLVTWWSLCMWYRRYRYHCDMNLDLSSSCFWCHIFSQPWRCSDFWSSWGGVGGKKNNGSCKRTWRQTSCEVHLHASTYLIHLDSTGEYSPLGLQFSGHVLHATLLKAHFHVNTYKDLILRWRWGMRWDGEVTWRPFAHLCTSDTGPSSSVQASKVKKKTKR